MDITELIRGAQAGNSAAFEQILQKHYDLIYRFAYQWCRNTADAEDITQQVCIKLARNLSQFRFESAFSSWLYRMVINTAKDWRKSQMRHEGDELGNISDELSAPDNAEAHVYLHQILHLLEGMADGYKETVLLVYAEGLTHAEAAKVLTVKESTVSWRLHEIRKQLNSLQGPVSFTQEVQHE